jgi:hypothetical protein
VARKDLHAVPELDEPAFTVLPANGGASDWSSARDGTMFFVSTTASSFELGGDGTSRTLVVWALSNTARLDAAAAPRLRHDVVGVQRYAMPPPAEQRPGDIPLQECLNADCFGFGTPPTPETLKELDAGDSRTGDATISGGTLVAVWGTAVRIGGATRDGVAYAEIDPSFTGGGLSADVGLHGALAASDQNLLEPSVALGTSGTGFIGLSITGPNRFPSVGYAAYELGRRPQLIRIATPGRGPDDGFTGTFLTAPDTRARWGDYGAAVPGAGGTIWIATEYIGQTCTLDEYRSSVGTCGGTRTALANWGTRLVRLDVR